MSIERISEMIHSKEVGGGYLSTSKLLIHAIGLSAAAVYCELVSRYKYFKEHGELTEDEYFFNTVFDLQKATGLTRWQQEPIIKILVKHELIFYELKGMPAKRYFKINEDTVALSELLAVGQETIIEIEKQQESERVRLESYKGKSGKSEKLSTGKTPKKPELSTGNASYQQNCDLQNEEKPRTRTSKMHVQERAKTSVNITNNIPTSLPKSNMTIVENFLEKNLSTIHPFSFKKKDTVFARVAESYKEEDIASAFDLVGQYVTRVYPSRTGKKHDAINKPLQMTFAEKFLAFAAHNDNLLDMQFGMDELYDFVNYMIKNIDTKDVDPTIYYITKPTVLGYWVLTNPDYGYHCLDKDSIYMPVQSYY